jgi:hypothetical protein
VAQRSDAGMVAQIGSLEIDIPRTIGYFGGIGAAVAIGLLEPPLGAFIAAVPFMKMLADRRSPNLLRFVGELVEGAAKPVGSSGEGTVRLTQEPDE